MGVYHGSIFAVDWTDLTEVIRVARIFAEGDEPMVVILRNENYNICFKSRRDTYHPADVVWDSEVE